MSRNTGRLGIDNRPQSADTETQSSEISFVAPTEYVDLPSKGLFYKEGHPLHGVDTIEVREMTAKEEDILTSRALIKKGVVFDKLLASTIVDKRIDPNSLLVGDRNAIIIALRISGYGAEYQTKVTCPMCMSHESRTHDLEELPHNNWEECLKEEGIAVEDGLFAITLPKTGLSVKARPLNGFDERQLSKIGDSDVVTGQLKRFIVAVNGRAEKEAIKAAVDQMPAMDAKYLRVTYKKITPNIDFEGDFDCSFCNFGTKLEMRLNPEFFWFE